MGYDYIIRVAANWNANAKDNTGTGTCTNKNKMNLDKNTVDMLSKMYGECRTCEKFYLHFGTDGHSGSRGLGCGMDAIHLEVLKKFTKKIPDMTLTFYLQYFDYEEMQIITIHDDTVLQNVCGNINEMVKPEYGLTYKSTDIVITDEIRKTYTVDCDDEESRDTTLVNFLRNSPTNIVIAGDITQIFYDPSSAMVGGLCFGPTYRKSIGAQLYEQ